MVSGATKTIKKYKGSPYLGGFLTPRTGNSLKTLDGLVYGCDNAAFNKFDEAKFFKMLNKIKGQNTKFVCCPDVVGNGQKTLELFEKWYVIIKEYNLPVAIVLQDGMRLNDIPFEKIDSVFIGGTDKFKLGTEVREIVRMAKLNNKWVHMGRVNSNKRLEYAFSIGCDSVDGSGYSMFPEKKIPDALKFLHELDNRGILF